MITLMDTAALDVLGEGVYEIGQKMTVLAGALASRGDYQLAHEVLTLKSELSALRTRVVCDIFAREEVKA